ncbi:protein CDV3 homolog isoform X3 [Oculina patagonica]
MSDNDKSLEDFFAKKAKGKKVKGKSKFTTSDAITKQVGGTQKEFDKDQPSKKTSGVTPMPSKPNEEEWIDFQEPTEKDYSGLRIQSLQIVENAEGEGSEGYEQEDEDNEGESSLKKDKAVGPWQQVPAAASQATAVGPQTTEEPKPVGAYKPPAYRAPGRRVPGVKSKTPEIDSEVAFPSLAAAMATNKSKETNGGKSFETVKHGSRTLESLADRGPQLDLGNKFDALRRS